MKKLLFAAFVTLSISISASAQNVNQLDQKAVNNFEASFAGASNVAWVSKDNLTIESFIKDESKVEVFYNTDGDFIASTTHIAMDAVPTFAKKYISKKYSDYTITDAFKFQADDEINYFIAAENEKETVILKVKQGSISVYSSTTKM